jgi:hypothetical protein
MKWQGWEEILQTRMVHWVTVLSLLCLGQSRLFAQGASDSPAKTGSDQSQTAVHERLSPASDPTRTRESRSQRDNRTVEKTQVERLGPDGRYEPYLDSEKETVQVDANTVRIVQRTFGRGPDGQKALMQIQEQETRTLPDGQKRVARTTSSPDVNGRIQIVEQELQQTRQTSPGVQVTKTTVMTRNVDGNLAPTVETEERQTKKDNHRLEFHKSTLVPDGNGGWQVSEVREGLVSEGNDKTQTTDERVLQADANGTLTLVGRKITKASENGPTERRQTEEDYSPNVPGGFGDGGLRLNQRVTKVQRVRGDGQQVTETQVEQINPAAPSEPPRLTEKSTDIVHPGASGTQSETYTIESLNPNGGLGVVWVDTSTVKTAPGVQVDMKKGNTPAVNVDTKSTQPK